MINDLKNLQFQEDARGAGLPAEDSIVRILRPYGSFTLLADGILIEGMVSHDPDTRGDASDIGFIVAEDKARNNPLFAGMAFSGTEISSTELPGTDFGTELPRLTEFKIYDSIFGQSTYYSELFSATFSFTKILDHLREPRTFRIAACIRANGNLSVSNFLICSVVPRSARNDARGGLSRSSSETVHSKFLVIEGWTLKPEDQVQEVEIYFDDYRAGAAEVGIASPEQQQALPYPEESAYSRFALACSREAISPHFSSGSFTVKAICKYQSGEQLIISGPKIRWLDAPANVTPFGEIESVRDIQDGIIEIRGWMINPALQPCRMFLEGRSFRIDLLDGVQLSRFPYPEIESRYAAVDRECRAGFTVHVRPDALGESPGRIVLAAETPDGRIEIGPDEMSAQLSAKVEAALAIEFTRKKLKAALSRALCAAGMRKKFPRPAAAQNSAAPLERILIASPNLSAVEGAPKVLYQIVRGLLRRGFRTENLRLIAAQDGQLKGLYSELGLNVEIRPELQTHRQTWNNYCGALRSVEQSVADFRPQFVLANVIDSFWAADLAARSKLPLLWCIHESADPLRHFKELEPRLRELYLQRLSESRIVFVAEQTRQVYRELVAANKSMVIRNGIDLERIACEQKSFPRAVSRGTLNLTSEFVVSIVGTTAHRKGQDVFLRAAAEILNRKPGAAWKFFVVGAREGKYLDKLRRRAKESLLEGRVIFVPETPETALYYGASDAIVIASREESSPLVSLEAFAYGVPLISTSVYGLAEQVSDRENALVFDSEDSSALASRIIELQEDSALAAKLVSGGKRTLEEKFSLDKSVESYADEIQRVSRG